MSADFKIYDYENDSSTGMICKPTACAAYNMMDIYRGTSWSMSSVASTLFTPNT